MQIQSRFSTVRAKRARCRPRTFARDETDTKTQLWHINDIGNKEADTDIWNLRPI